ncbi:MAG TPA: hypothetical protein VIW24_01290 [Aldersonia sp.]
MHATLGFIRDLDLDSWSLRPSWDETGIARPASISISLFGHPEPDAPRVTLSMTLDEAEELAGTLARLVANARQDRFSEPRQELPQSPRQEDMRRAWNDLVAEDIEDDEDGADGYK